MSKTKWCTEKYSIKIVKLLAPMMFVDGPYDLLQAFETLKQYEAEPFIIDTNSENPLIQ